MHVNINRLGGGEGGRRMVHQGGKEQTGYVGHRSFSSVSTPTTTTPCRTIIPTTATHGYLTAVAAAVGSPWLMKR